MLLLVLLAQTAASEPPKSAPTVPIAIVVSSRRDAGNTLSSALCTKVRDALAARGIEAMTEQQSADRLAKLGAIDPHACDGSKLCLAKLAELLQGIVIGVDIGKVGRFNAGHLEAVAIGRLESVAVADFTSDSKGWSRKTGDELPAFIAPVASMAAEMNKALVPVEPPKAVAVAPTPPPVEKKSDAPLEPKLLPVPPPTPPPVVVEETRSRGPVPYIVGGTAVALAIVAVTMLALASADSDAYHSRQETLSGGQTSPLTRAELDRLAGSANLKYSAALGTGIGAGVVGIAAGYLLIRDP
jgi:hypothetical protein